MFPILIIEPPVPVWEIDPWDADTCVFVSPALSTNLKLAELERNTSNPINPKPNNSPDGVTEEDTIVDPAWSDSNVLARATLLFNEADTFQNNWLPAWANPLPFK